LSKLCPLKSKRRAKKESGRLEVESVKKTMGYATWNLECGTWNSAQRRSGIERVLGKNTVISDRKLEIRDKRQEISGKGLADLPIFPAGPAKYFSL
jgi:hypothetical protein